MCIASTAMATVTAAPTISQSEGGVTEIIQSSSYQKLKHGSELLKEILAQQVAKYANPKDFYTLYNVIDCESSWNEDAKNKDSSASGLAQFLDSTWNGYCGGDKNNPKDQIHCLVIAWTAGYQSWWSESRSCWGPFLTH